MHPPQHCNTATQQRLAITYPKSPFWERQWLAAQLIINFVLILRGLAECWVEPLLRSGGIGIPSATLQLCNSRSRSQFRRFGQELHLFWHRIAEHDARGPTFAGLQVHETADLRASPGSRAETIRDMVN